MQTDGERGLVVLCLWFTSYSRHQNLSKALLTGLWVLRKFKQLGTRELKSCKFFLFEATLLRSSKTTRN